MKSQPRRKRFPCGEIFEEFQPFLIHFLLSCKILGKHLMPLATLAFFCFWFKRGFFFVLGSRFVFGLRLEV